MTLLDTQKDGARASRGLPRGMPRRMWRAGALIALCAALGLSAAAVRAQVLSASPTVFSLPVATGGTVTVTVQTGAAVSGTRADAALLCAELAGGVEGVHRTEPCSAASVFGRVGVGVNATDGPHTYRASFGPDTMAAAVRASASAGRLEGSRRFYVVASYLGPTKVPQWIATRVDLVEPARTGLTSATHQLIDVALDAPTPISIRYTQAGNDTPLAGQFCSALAIPYPPRGVADGSPCAAGSVLGAAGAAVGFRAAPLTGEHLVVPESVARLAAQAARASGQGVFYFARRFASGQWGVVRLRLTGDLASAALAFTDIRLAFQQGAGQQGIGFFARGQRLPPVAATLRYRGGGLMRARWEVVMPGDELPSPLDLTAEASLDAADRTRQRRYRVLDRIQVILPAVGRGVLPGPDPRLLPNDQYGQYLLLLRIEASDSLSDSKGGRAPFVLPVLRYHIGETSGPAASAVASADTIALLPTPMPNPSGDERAVVLAWRAIRQGAIYRLEVDVDGVLLHAARVRFDSQQETVQYTLPPFVTAGLPSQGTRWRVLALDAEGRPTGISDWRDIATRP